MLKSCRTVTFAIIRRSASTGGGGERQVREGAPSPSFHLYDGNYRKEDKKKKEKAKR